MKIPEATNLITLTLNDLYPNPPIPLHHKDPYTLLIAVILSARCTDARVNTITPTLFKLADNPYDMAKQTIETVQKIIRPCGLSPAKSKGIVGLSQILIDKHNGQVPHTFDELEALPSVGHKTASVVLCQAFQIPAFPVDTHIYRLARRWGISKAKSINRVEKDLKAAFPESSWIKLHLQMICYGREYCTAHGCNGSTCPICKAMNSGNIFT